MLAIVKRFFWFFFPLLVFGIGLSLAYLEYSKNPLKIESTPLSLMFLFFLFVIVSGCLTGLQSYQGGYYGKDPIEIAKRITIRNKFSYNQIKAIPVGILVSLEACAGIFILIDVYTTLFFSILNWIAPALHIPMLMVSIKPDNPLALSVLPIYLAAYGGSMNGVQAFLRGESNSKIFQEQFFLVIILCSILFIFMPMLLIFLSAGWYLLSNAQCTRDPRIHGGVIIFLSLMIALLMTKKFHLFSDTTIQEGMPVRILLVGIIFSFLTILDTLILCY